MSQVAINVCNRKLKRAPIRRSNGGQLAGFILLLTMLSAILLGSWMIVGWMKDSHCLPLSRLVVTGERYYTTNDDIRQSILAIGAPGTFMTQDINAIQRQIERMSWIKHVNVRKQWPDELKIHVVEYVPVARWNDLCLLDSSGKVFRAPVGRVSNQSMPMLYGPEGSERDVLSGYHAINEILTTAPKFQIKTVSMGIRHSWQVTLKDDIRLELGRNDRAKRLQRFIKIYPILLWQAWKDNKRINYVDLRYDSGLAVGWASAYIEPENSNQR